jgi:hypothetical protein
MYQIVSGLPNIDLPTPSELDRLDQRCAPASGAPPMSKSFVVEIEYLEYSRVIERRIKTWREMIRAKINVPPIKIRPKPNMPGYWIVFSGEVAVEAARREGYSSIECITV